MALTIIASFLISALMGMGIGGGGLFVIYLTLCLNFEQILAQGTNLIFFIISALFSLFIHLRKRKIRFLQVGALILFGSLGSLMFSHLANLIDPKTPRIALGILLISSGIYTIITNTIFKKTK
jgi:uncharacterized membrane protein YfcA